ncbi:MAG TPA: cell division protein SepF [Clostridiales bacterium]|nr:cell division protein SepF [Clostridiales bacterium]
MRGGWLDRLLSLLGFERVDALDADEEPGEPPPAENPAETAAAQDGLPIRPVRQLVPLPGGQRGGLRVNIVEPAKFDEVAAIADHLRERQPIIVVLEEADKELARRVVDFVSGATYALQGVTRRVSPGVFLFAPPNVEVASRQEEEGER